MKPAFTPGPWAVEETYGLNSRTAYVRAPSWGVVASVGLDPSLPHWDGPQRANARLIAAATVMYAALIDCREALRRAGATGELAVVDAAIAIAIGETSE